MEAKLKTDSIEYLKNVLDTAFTHEETSEIIVPDAYPDMQEIVDVEGTVTLRSKEADSGRVSLSGTVGASVVYLPEGETCLKKLELNIPFTTGCDAADVTDDAKLSVSAKVGSIDARMINSRKALVRVDVLVEALCYELTAMSCTADLEEEEDAGLQVRKEQAELSFVTQVREKTFVLADEFSLPPGKPPVEDILKTRVRLASDDVKNVGNKLIFKGSAFIRVMYTAADTPEPCVADFTATFSQIMELEGEAEGATYDIGLMLTNIYVETGASDAAGLAVEMHMVAQAAERRSRSVEYLADAYSTKYELENQQMEYTLESLDGSLTVPAEVRETVELPGVVRVIDASARVGKVSISQDSGKLILRTPVSVSAVYVTEEGKLCGMNRRFEAKGETDARSNMTYTASAEAGEDLLIAPGPEGISVKVPVQFTLRPCRKVRFSALNGVSWDEERPRDLTALPSVVVYNAEGGEDLWHLAKRYCSTEDLILGANGIAEDAPPYPGQLFIIPKAR